MSSFDENLFTQWHEIWSQPTRDCTHYHTVKTWSLSHLHLNWYRVMSHDRRTDRIMTASMRLALCAVMCKKCNIILNANKMKKWKRMANWRSLKVYGKVLQITDYRLQKPEDVHTVFLNITPALPISSFVLVIGLWHQNQNNESINQSTIRYKS